MNGLIDRVLSFHFLFYTVMNINKVLNLEVMKINKVFNLERNHS